MKYYFDFVNRIPIDFLKKFNNFKINFSKRKLNYFIYFKKPDSDSDFFNTGPFFEKKKLI